MSVLLRKELEELRNKIAYTAAGYGAGSESAFFDMTNENNQWNILCLSHFYTGEPDDEATTRAIVAMTKIIRARVRRLGARDAAIQVGKINEVGHRQYCLISFRQVGLECYRVLVVITRCSGMEEAEKRLARLSRLTRIKSVG